MFNPSEYIEFQLNKESILEKISPEEIFSFYTKFQVELNTKFKSPLRKDNIPTCNYFYSRSNQLILHDHSGHFSGNCFDFVMKLYNIEFKTAILKIASDFNLLDSNYKLESIRMSNLKVKISNEKTDIRVRFRKWSKSDLKYWNSFGISESTLKRFRVFPAKEVWLGETISYSYSENDPCYVYYFTKVDLKAYYPFRKNFRFIGNSNRLQGYSLLPEKGDILIVTKSYKDVMTLYEYGYTSVAPQSETQGLSQKAYDILSSRFTKIYSFYDFDLTGIRTANKMKKNLGITPIFLTNGRFGTYNYNAKDPSDLVRILTDEIEL